MLGGGGGGLFDDGFGPIASFSLSGLQKKITFPIIT